MTIITLQNPWSGAIIDMDITGLDERTLLSYLKVADEEICEKLNRDLAPCLPEEFLAAYVDRVGMETAGRVILGS